MHLGVTPRSRPSKALAGHRVFGYDKPMKIGELSKKSGLSADTIRFYEKSGVIQRASRTPGGYREYSAENVATIEFIVHCRALDIPLSEIRKLLHVRSGSSKSCREVNSVIDEQIRNLRERLRELKSLEKNLTELRSVCNQELDPKDCRILQSLQKR